MPTETHLLEIQQYLQARCGLIVLNTYEEERWLSGIREMADREGWQLDEWSEVSSNDSREELLTQLRELALGENSHRLFLLKDIQSQLNDPHIVRALREACQQGKQFSNTILLMGPDLPLPLELEKEGVRIDLPLPDYETMQELVEELLAEVCEIPDSPYELDSLRISPFFDRITQTLLGLTLSQARYTLSHGLQKTNAKINERLFLSLVNDKQGLLQGSDLLEYYDLSTDMESVGGLDTLKEWLEQRSTAFTETARRKGIPAPRGVLIIGVQGCGKSLTARAVAHMLKFPLLRLDISTLLASERGISERNMRMALQTAETMAPSVLWIDELDKGFAGASIDGKNDSTLSRLLGRFLSWMEGQRGNVFVVATANNIDQLPPETVRRGRFDELFFVDLPNYYERTEIFKIHMQRRQCDPTKFDLHELVEKTDGYSGAEVEQIVASTLLECYSTGRTVTQEEFLESADEIVPLSKTMEEKIFEMREWAQGRCRRATPDSRVQQMLDQEKRSGHLQEEPALATAQREWKRLTEQDNLAAAIAEYVRVNDQCTFEEIKNDFAPYFNTQGEHGLVIRQNPKVMLAVNLSEELNQLLSQLITGRRIYLHPTEASAYKRKLPLSVLSGVPQNRQRDFAWLPTCLRIVPPVHNSQVLSQVGRIRKSSATSEA
ncbi:MAG: AAA family ATPase [Planctomycetaceae bacterium]|nr:AAA family ATPase [Planctomycetaceae bacterium]